MKQVTACYFRQHLKLEVDKVIENHEILYVTRRHGGNFVVLSVEDWRAIEETLYLNRVPGLADSIHRAAAEPLQEGLRLEELDW